MKDILTKTVNYAPFSLEKKVLLLKKDKSTLYLPSNSFIYRCRLCLFVVVIETVTVGLKTCRHFLTLVARYANNGVREKAHI